MPTVIRELKANLLLIPTLSIKMDAFRTLASDVATWNQGITVIANGAFDQVPGANVVFGVPAQSQKVFEKQPPTPSAVILTIGNQYKSPRVSSYPLE